MAKAPNPGGSYVSHGRVGRAPAPRGIENAQGMTVAEQAYDDLLMDQHLEDMEYEREAGHWPAAEFGTVPEDARISAALEPWPDFDPADIGIYGVRRASDDHEEAA